MDLIIKAKLNPNDDAKTAVDIIVEQPRPVPQLKEQGKVFAEVFGSVHADVFWDSGDTKGGGGSLYKRIQEGEEINFILVPVSFTEVSSNDPIS